MTHSHRHRTLRLLAFAGLLVAALVSAWGGALAQERDAATGIAPSEDYTPFPQPGAGYVTDHAELLTRDQEEEIEQWLWQVESRTGVEVIVMTLESIKDYPLTPNRDIEDFATALFNRYGIGNLPDNHGVLLLVAVKDRKARIELGDGYASVRDVDAARIMDGVIVPEFKKGDYPAGISDGVEAIVLEFADVRIGYNWPLIALIVAIPLLALLAISLFRNGKRGWGWIVLGLLLIVVLLVIYLLVQTARHLPKTASSGWSSGGLGGFGGGFSSGGGATGSW